MAFHSSEPMSLTKDDLQQIENIVTKAISQSLELIIIPFVEAKIDELDRKLTGRIDRLEERLDSLEYRMKGLENRMDHVDERVQELKKKLDERFLTLHDKIEENTVLVGYYFEQCATKEQVNDHEGRLKRLEIPA